MAGTISNPALGVIRHRQRGVIALVADIVTDASGDASATVIGSAFGRLRRVLYNGGLDASAVITIKDENTGATLVAYTTGTEGTPVAFQPTEVITTVAGVAVTADASAPNVNRPILVSGKVSVTVASGGNAETGKVKLIIDEAGLGEGLLN